MFLYVLRIHLHITIHIYIYIKSTTSEYSDDIFRECDKLLHIVTGTLNFHFYILPPRDGSKLVEKWPICPYIHKVYSYMEILQQDIDSYELCIILVIIVNKYLY